MPGRHGVLSFWGVGPRGGGDSSLRFRGPPDGDVAARNLLEHRSVMQLICFRCQSDRAGEGPTCAACGFLLIARATETVKPLPMVAVDELLERTDETPLPGVSPEPRKAQLLMERRRRRLEAKRRREAEAAEAQREADEVARRDRTRRRWFVGEIFAASALAALGVSFALRAFGALH